MPNKTGTKRATGKAVNRKPKSADGGKPKRSCNAFCFYLRDKGSSLTTFSSDNMKVLHDQWKQMDAKQKEPYERAAAADSNRYHREKARWESSRVKRPCNAYIKFLQHFMATNSSSYDNVRDAVSAGAAQWKSMSDDQKAPWKKLAGTDSRKYAATKPTMIKAKPSMAKAKAKPKAKSCAAKPKARPKVTFAKAKVGKVSAKLTKSKVAGTKKSPKTIRRIKITKTAKTVKKIKPSKTAKTTRKIKSKKMK